MKRISIVKNKITATLRSFSKTEQTLFVIFALALIVGTFGVAAELHQRYSIRTPAHGGTLVEGIVGTPRFINPLLAIGNADKDLTALVYSGLVRFDGRTFVPDLAQYYEATADGLRYTFTLREGAVFHDGTPVTADDVIFTISKARESALKSPERINWEGVRVEKIDDRTIAFALSQPYAGFLQNATLGILPEHIWGNLSVDEFNLSSFNVRPIGTGPYRITASKKNSDGIPTEYTLRAFKYFALERPYIQKIILKFYPNETSAFKAWRRGNVEALGAITPEHLSPGIQKRKEPYTAPLPRIFGVFFNQTNAPVFTDPSVLQALEASVGKDRIINDVLFGFGTKIDGPLPPHLGTPSEEELRTTEERRENARSILARGGWNWNEAQSSWTKGGNELQFSLSTGNVPELKRTAELLKEDFEAIGIPVELKIFETGNLDQDVIRPRNYEALLFGQIITYDTDLFAFWHSSQRNDPGLNVALYANSRVDSALEKAVTLVESEERLSYYKIVEDEIKKDRPALFLYAPDLIYFLPHKIKNVTLEHITEPNNRFTSIHTWSIKTDRVWRLFAKKTISQK